MRHSFIAIFSIVVAIVFVVLFYMTGSSESDWNIIFLPALILVGLISLPLSLITGDSCFLDFDNFSSLASVCELLVYVFSVMEIALILYIPLIIIKGISDYRKKI